MVDGELCVCREEDSIPEKCMQDLKAKDRRLLHSLVVAQSTRIDQLIQCEHFSSAQRLLRVTEEAQRNNDTNRAPPEQG